MPTALITGITGQDGSYLAEFLLEQGYQVVGLVRRTSTVNFQRIRHIQKRLQILRVDDGVAVEHEEPSIGPQRGLHRLQCIYGSTGPIGFDHFDIPRQAELSSEVCAKWG